MVAFEEDSYARDLTPRYAREYGAKVAKAQVGGKGRKEWWDRVLGTVTRPYRLVRWLTCGLWADVRKTLSLFDRLGHSIEMTSKMKNSLLTRSRRVCPRQ